MAFDFPNSPTVGAVYTAPTGVTYTWDGEKWSSGSGYGAIYISDSAPAAPVGSLWWQSSTGTLYVSYNDGNSIQWVAISGGIADAVRYATVQTLTAGQKQQAQSNVYLPPTITRITSGSGTYNTPTGCTWFRLRMVGGGAGGSGSGTSQPFGTAGGATTFGPHTANGGGIPSSPTGGGVGGQFTIGAGAVGFGVVGQGGQAGVCQAATNAVIGGGGGGGSMMGGGAFGPGYSAAGQAASANSGGGGSGGGSNNVVNSTAGPGGGGGGGMDIIIAAPAATYAYSVGAAGTAGVAGTSGLAGGGGGAGIIVVEEHYGS
jgi:hypothetical protein